jgi:hypothetical protein
MDQQQYLALAGVILGIVVSLIKSGYRAAFGQELEGAAAYWLSFALSLLAAVGVLALTGELTAPPADPLAFLAWFAPTYALVAGAATTVYKVVISRESGLRRLVTQSR